MYYENYTPAPPVPKKRIDNIFSALVYEKTPGAVMEFSLWCTVCVVVVMALVAAILGDGNVTWIMLMLFSAGMAVLMAFRLKPITLLYGAVTMNFLLFLIHFLCFSFYDRYDTGDLKYSALNTVLFILLLITAIVLVIFSFIHFFSRYNFGNAIAVIVLIQSVLIVVLQILMYACPLLGELAEDINVFLRRSLNDDGYWFGTASYWLMLLVLCLFYAFFFWGCIDNRKGKIISIPTGNVANMTNPANAGSASAMQNPVAPALKGIAGIYVGQTIPFKERDITIGSKQCQITINDPFVSEKHCAVRFNMTIGCYEVYDASANGTYLQTGERLQSGVYTPVQRGSILWVGSKNQQFRLL
ncbi:MAG: FHA domain-containing protein [Lachnospiraceae bacterium]|nr:FHA domain-containing protein [Lachnospiraceae bacterium]